LLSTPGLVLVSLLATAFGATTTASTSSDLVVDLGYAKFKGFFNETTGLNTWFNIRYAASPTGTLKWRAPHPPQHTAGVLDATVMGPQCFNSGAGLSLTSPFLNFKAKRSLDKRAIASDEDCLLLNVYSPPAAQKKKLPVVFWIHGGGYMAGNADMTGEDLVHNSQDQVVAVLIQYRLGLWGFLPGSEVKKNGDLNVGLLDQQFALQWVQQHVSQFGGDPNDVTIWGESAGAGSVLQHLIANGGDTQPPLFKRAITSSTFLPFQYNFDDPIPEKVFSDVAASVNCTDSAAVMECLRSVSAGDLETANINVGDADFFGEFQFIPVVDGTFIRESPVAIITKGKLNGDLLLAITNTLEGSIFVSSATNGTIAEYIQNAVPTLDKENVQRAAEIYSNIPGVNGVLDQAFAVQGEVIFICPTYFLLQAFGDRVHKGLFAVPPGTHGEDVNFYFHSLGPSFNNPAFIASFSQVFSDFQVSADVNKKVSSENLTPFWPKWTDGHTEMVFNRTADSSGPDLHTTTTDPALLDRCAFWKALAPQIGQ